MVVGGGGGVRSGMLLLYVRRILFDSCLRVAPSYKKNTAVFFSCEELGLTRQECEFKE